MTISYYITPTDYSVAQQNGVSRVTLENRIRNLAWDKSKAVNTPPRPRKSLKELWELARVNGIPYATLQKRIQVYMWDPERAVTEPLMDKKMHMKNIKQRRRKYPLKYVEQAEKNGICYHTFRSRMSRGWSLERASTVKTKVGSERQFKDFIFREVAKG